MPHTARCSTGYINTRQDASNFADAVGRQVSSETLQLLKDQPQHVLHQQLAAAAIPDQDREEEILIEQDLKMFAMDSSIADPEIFEDYLIVDRDGVVLSSSRAELIGKYFAFPAGTMERIMLRKTIIDFPDQDAASDLLSRNIAFGALIDENKGAVFIMASPRRILAKILRRGFSGNYGEVYLVDSEGRFISEPRWKEEIFDKGWVNPDAASVVGVYAGQHGKADKPSDLPLSVRRVSRRGKRRGIGGI